MNVRIAAATIAVGISACQAPEKKYAEEQGREYAESLGMKDAKVTCVNEDTNKDGYVSCTVATPSKDGGKPDMQPIECAAQRDGCSANRGCRVPKQKEASP